MISIKNKLPALALGIATLLLAEVANAQTNWTQVTPAAPWSPRGQFGAVAFNNQLWVMGGTSIIWYSSDVWSPWYFNDVWSSPDGTNWVQATGGAPWSARDNFAAVAFNGQMWVLGGFANGNFNDVWASPDGTNWTQVTSAAPWGPRYGLEVVAFNGQMWVLGGNSSGNRNDVWSSADGTNWTQVTSAAPWAGRNDFGAIVFNGQMWVLGGSGDNSAVFGDAWSSTDGVNWTEVTNAAPWGPRENFGAVTLNRQPCVLGGYNGNNSLHDVWSSSDGTNWTQVTAVAPWSPRSSFGCAALNGHVAWVMGGVDGSGGFLNDIWSAVSLLAASFTAAPSNGFAPLSVTFTDTSTGPITNWFWDFGDGNTTNFTAATNPTHTYGLGIYTVTLVVSGPGGVSTNTQPNCILAAIPDTISTISSPSAGGTTAGGGAYTNGSTVTVCATPNTCYSFVNWTDPGGNVLSSSACCSFTATSDTNIVANFAPIAYTVSTSSHPPCDWGSTTGGGTYACNSTVTVCATPAPCYNFVAWADQSANWLSTSNCYTFTPSSNTNLVAGFEQRGPFLVYARSSPASGGSISNQVSYACVVTTAADVTVCATPSNCYSFVNWTDQNNNVLSTSMCYTFAPTNNCIRACDILLFANFAPALYYTITTSSSPAGGGSTSGGGTYCGSSVTVCATPNACYSFVNWTDQNSNVVSTSACYSFTAAGNQTLVANFTLNQYTVTAGSSPAGGGSTSGAGTYGCGSNATVCATTNACYNFVNWTDQNSNVVSTSACYPFTAASNETLVANFTVNSLPTNSSLTNLWIFTNGLDGAAPYAGLVQGSDSNFYGTTYGSGSGPSANGTVFKISSGGVLTNLWSFTGDIDGANPLSGLVQGSDGNFYGTTSEGGASGYGTVFRIGPSSSLTNLWEFTGGSDGANPVGGLVQGSDGNFYGTTYYGGNTNLNYGSGYGTVFKISSSGSLTNLWSFTSGIDGANPYAGLVQGNDGNLYGTTSGSGSGPSAYGTVFRISPGGSLSNLWSFTGGTDGASPYAGLVQGSDSNFYGTTYGSGSGPSPYGTVFGISPSGSLSNLWSFTGGTDGANPYAGLVQGSDGNFYGTTYYGGANSNGTVFWISPSGSLSNLWSFTGCGDAANPYAGLVLGNDGNLYGTTSGSGSGPSAYGTVFKLSIVQVCSFSIGTTNATFGPTGGIGAVDVTASSTNCSWATSDTNSFIAITAGSSGSGSGTVSYAVAVNSNTTARTGTLMIAGLPFTVTQASGDSVGDGIPDWWRAQYFSNVSTNGTTTNGQSCATCDADGIGQNNLFKYIAGLDPTNPASVLVLNIASTNHPSQNNLFFTPLALGRIYTPQFSTDLTSGVWLPLTTYIGPLTNNNGNQVTITDTNPIPPQEFYRIQISLPQ